MPLHPGAKIGVYMKFSNCSMWVVWGTVYRARDTVLKRDVAVKAQPEAFSRDADRLLRFQREAKCSPR
jgi:hypothetical protein